MSIKKSVFCQKFKFHDNPPYLDIAAVICGDTRPTPAAHRF